MQVSDFWQRFQAFFVTIPDTLQPAFFAELARHNYSRAIVLSLGLMIIHAGLIGLNFSQRYQNGVWQSVGYEQLAYLHFILEGVLALWLLLVVFFNRKTASPAVQYRWAFVFSFFMMIWCAALSSSDQKIHGQITVYIIALFGLAATQYYSLRASLVLYGIPHTALLFGIAEMQSDAQTASAHYINASVAAILAWLLSRLAYANFAREFLLRQKEKELLHELSKQAEHLAKEKQHTDRLLRELSEASWELALTNESLQRANTFKTELFEIAAHDLKNPLQAIVGFSHLIDELNDIAKVKEMNKVIYRNAERMFGLISEFLEQANIEQQVQNLETSLTNLSSLTEQVVSRFTHQAALKQQSITTHIEPNCFAKVDSVLIQSVLENLLSNAIKYSPEGKTITVNCEKRQARSRQQETISKKQEEKVRVPLTCIRISVQDEGQGLSEEDMKQLFGKFKRLSATPTGGENSTGLGLYLARQIIDRHGGRIWAESDGKDKGATFFIELPSAVEKVAEA